MGQYALPHFSGQAGVETINELRKYAVFPKLQDQLIVSLNCSCQIFKFKFFYNRGLT